MLALHGAFSVQGLVASHQTQCRHLDCHLRPRLDLLEVWSEDENALLLAMLILSLGWLCVTLTR